MICMQIGHKNSLSSSDVAASGAGKTSPETAPGVSEDGSAAACLDVSDLTTAGTSGPAERSSIAGGVYHGGVVVVASFRLRFLERESEGVVCFVLFFWAVCVCVCVCVCVRFEGGGEREYVGP